MMRLPVHPTPLFPFSVSLGSSLLFFSIPSFFLRYTGRNSQAHGGTQWHRIRKRSLVVEKTPWDNFHCHCVITCHFQRSQKSLFVSLHVRKTAIYSPLNSSISAGVKKKRVCVKKIWISGEKSNIFFWWNLKLCKIMFIHETAADAFLLNMMDIIKCYRNLK